MQDLDYDELDKAVNSLMPQKAVATDADDQSSPTTATTSSNDEPAPLVNNPITTQTSSSSVIKTVERPSTGRFMDVVRPSADMRPSVNLPQRPTPSAPSPSQPNISSTQIAQTSNQRPNYTPPSFTNKEQPTTTNWAGLDSYQAPAETPESPFLTEAKVEKRPLGAFSDEVPVSVAPDVVDTNKPQDDNESDKEASKVTKIEEKLPAELDSSILSVESDSSTHQNEADLRQNPLSQTTASINQQYTEKPSSGDQNNGSIYDTSSYHKAVIHQPKKKSGWLIVVWIILLLIGGVGAGVAFYFFVMPNLVGLKLPF